MFALALGSKQLLLSDEITSESRLLLHRDVHDRLETLAPFIHWDSEAMPLTANGHVVFVVDGYTTSTSYPYAEQVALGEVEGQLRTGLGRSRRSTRSRGRCRCT